MEEFYVTVHKRQQGSGYTAFVPGGRFPGIEGVGTTAAAALRSLSLAIEDQVGVSPNNVGCAQCHRPMIDRGAEIQWCSAGCRQEWSIANDEPDPENSREP